MNAQSPRPQLTNGFGLTAFDESNYRDFFTRLTSKGPYCYQVELAKKLTEGKSVILRAPTGSGKTWATVAPFIYSVATSKRLADRLIYALPLRALASNIYSSTDERLKKMDEFRGRICGSAKNRRYDPGDPFYLGLQMGGQQDDPFFEGDITFTTIDQLLSSYLFAPVSLPNRLGNIGAGALIGSLLVFDEVHLLDPERSLATTIEMLVRLKGLAQFVLMTATVPDSVMRWLEEKLDAKSLSLSAEEVLQLPSHAEKKCRFEWRPTPLTAEDIVGEHRDRTIAIVNTVGRAQELFRDVCKKMQGRPNPPEIFLLHSRFFRKDRECWESKLTDYFGPKATLGNAILISTQVVEAGIDISADVLLTELAPLSSLLQRAGRVARYESRNTGKFLVFELAQDSQGQPRLGPYRDVREIIVATRELLASKNGILSLSYSEELNWLTCVHDGPDLNALKHLNSLHTHQQYVLSAMDGLDDSPCSRLIRETGSVNVVLTSEPEALKFTAREWPELLSVPRSSLFRFREACESAGTSGWVLKVPQEIESESSESLKFDWGAIRNPAAISWLVAINPAYASYSRKIGLDLDTPSDEIPSVEYKMSPPTLRYSYQKESFVTHAKRVADRGSRILAWSPHAMHGLRKIYQGFNLADVFLLACALHDTGKLQISWQVEAERWQQHIDLKLRRDHNPELLAHTDFDPERDRGDQWCRFPPHAACGGFSLLPYFMQQFADEVAIVLCTAITRHHGTHTTELAQFELIQEAASILDQCITDTAARPVSVELEPQPGDLACFSEDYLLHLKETEDWWALYASVVRVLRLADQGSFQD